MGGGDGLVYHAGLAAVAYVKELFNSALAQFVNFGGVRAHTEGEHDDVGLYGLLLAGLEVLGDHAVDAELQHLVLKEHLDAGLLGVLEVELVLEQRG